jgi:hypothetical protein
MVQVPPEVKKLLPVTVIVFPIPEEVGVRVIFGTTVKMVVALSPSGRALTWTSAPEVL